MRWGESPLLHGNTELPPLLQSKVYEKRHDFTHPGPKPFRALKVKKSTLNWAWKRIRPQSQRMERIGMQHHQL